MTGDMAFGRMRRSTAVISAAVVVVVSVAAWLLSRRGEPPAPAGEHNHAAAPAAGAGSGSIVLGAEAAGRIGVTYAPVVRGPLGREVRTVATVTFDETRLATVGVRVDGWIERLHVNITGQPVRRGEPLYSIYSPMLVSAQQELLLASRLAGEVAAGTPDAAKGTTELLESARRRLAYWEVPAEDIAAIERQGEVRKAVTFRSPVQGVVLEKLLLPGQKVMAGETAFRIADLSVVWLEGEVYERDLPAARIGLSVSADFPALPGTVRTGRISYLYPTLNPETRTARIRVELANPGLALKPGMYATLRFSAPTAAVLSVPRSAVLMTGERNLVFVRMPDGMLMAHDVTVGIATDDRIEILSGVSERDTVVASATFLVDAESSLSSALGGMGAMPGMDMGPPKPAKDPHANMKMD